VIKQILLIAAFLFMALVPPHALWADDLGSAWDLSFKFGMTFGSVSSLGLPSTATNNGTPIASNVPTVYTFGGVPLEIGINRDLSSSFTAYLGFQVLADVVNMGIDRTAFNLEIAYHLFGGARRIVKDIGGTEVILREPSNFSLVAQGSFQQYGARTKSGDTELTGSAFALEGGLQYRFDTSEESAIAIELLTTIVPLPASAEQTSPSLTTLVFSYRFFL
jgi:hypothetical protein